MATKTITITEEAYKTLLKYKGIKESFSQLFLRLAKKRGRVMDCFGSWKMSEEEEKNFQKIMNSWHMYDEKLRKEWIK